MLFLSKNMGNNLNENLINKKVSYPIVALTLGLFTALIMTIILSVSSDLKMFMDQSTPSYYIDK